MEAFKKAEMLQNTFHKYTDDRHEVCGSCKSYHISLEFYFTDINPVKPYLEDVHLFQIQVSVSLLWS